MHSIPAYAIETFRRPTSLARFVVALLCMVGLYASLLQPRSPPRLSKTEASFQTVFANNNALRGDKPCQRMVPGAVGTSCSAGAMVALDAATSVVLEPLSSTAGAAPFVDMTLHVQWFGAPQFRPPRIFA